MDWIFGIGSLVVFLLLWFVHRWFSKRSDGIWSRGWSEGFEKMEPTSQQPSYLSGWTAGKRQRDLDFQIRVTVPKRKESNE